jgi:hypothetical protein
MTKEETKVEIVAMLRSYRLARYPNICRRAGRHYFDRLRVIS